VCCVQIHLRIWVLGLEGVTRSRFLKLMCQEAPVERKPSTNYAHSFPLPYEHYNTLTLTYSHAHYIHLLIRTFYAQSFILHAHSPHLLLPVHTRSTYPHSFIPHAHSPQSLSPVITRSTHPHSHIHTYMRIAHAHFYAFIHICSLYLSSKHTTHPRIHTHPYTTHAESFTLTYTHYTLTLTRAYIMCMYVHA
jgi:hypothetical protein